MILQSAIARQWLAIACITMLGATSAPTARAQAPIPDVVFHNGTILTMEAPASGAAEAFAVHADSIIAVGSNSDILNLAGEASRRVDLGGLTVIPGFVDAHSHIFNEAANQGMTFADVQGIALRFGVTTVGNLYTTPELIEALESFRDEGRLRLRTSLYLSRTDNCGADLGGWYLDYPPTDGRDIRLRIGGVKIFTDGGTCGSPATTFEYRDGFGDLWMSQDQLNQIVAEADAAGFQVAIHAQGDRAVEQAQNAIAAVLGGGPNILKHRIDHNAFIRDDLLGRYDEIGIVAVIFGSYATCAEVKFGALSRIFGEENVLWLEDWRALLDANPNLHAAWHSDYPFLVLDPIRHLYSYVTRTELDESGQPCLPPDWLLEHAITPMEALSLMTRGASYALDWDDHIGSLEPGKLADFVILSHDPTNVDPQAIIETEILATYLGGRLAYCRQGSESLCGLPVAVEDEKPDKRGARIETVAPNPAGETVSFSYTLNRQTRVVITLFDLQGRIVARPVSANESPGVHHGSFATSGLPAGVYFVRLQTDHTVDVRKVAVR